MMKYSSHNLLSYNQYQNDLTACSPGPDCLKVVDIEIKGTTAFEFHCSGSCPAWMASVPKCGKGL